MAPATLFLVQSRLMHTVEGPEPHWRWRPGAYHGHRFGTARWHRASPCPRAAAANGDVRQLRAWQTVRWTPAAFSIRPAGQNVGLSRGMGLARRTYVCSRVGRYEVSKRAGPSTLMRHDVTVAVASASLWKATTGRRTARTRPRRVAIAAPNATAYLRLGATARSVADEPKASLYEGKASLLNSLLAACHATMAPPDRPPSAPWWWVAPERRR